MRVLIVFCHPYEESYGAALLERASRTLADRGHETRILDLYQSGFAPVLSREEWLRYMSDTQANIAAVQDHVDALCWADALILIYPTWVYGPPAMLKGWMERVFLPGVAFDIAPERKLGLRGRSNSHFRNFELF